MSGELMETYDEYGHIIVSSKKNNHNTNHNHINKINTEDEVSSIMSPRNLPSSAHTSRMKYYRSLQKLSEKTKKNPPPPPGNASPKSETRQNNDNNNNNNSGSTNDQESRRFSDPQYYRSDPIAIPLQSPAFISSHRFRSALHPRLVVDSSASYVLPAPSYIPTPQRKTYLPMNNNNNNNNNNEDDNNENREGMRKKLINKYQWEDKQFSTNNNRNNNNNNNDHSSQEEEDDGGFAFEMEL